MKCPICNGKGSGYESVLWKGSGGGEFWICDICNGEGKISFLKWLKIILIIKLKL